MARRLGLLDRVVILGLLLLLGTPLLLHVLWLAGPRRTLDVLVWDKTVARDPREHAGVHWVLNHLRYLRPDGARYRYDRDYAGFFPGEQSERRIHPLPDPLGRFDVVYAADTYGVYTDDLAGENRAGERSSLVYGGVLPEEAEALRRGIGRGATLVGEFNTLASPTGGAARRTLSTMLGVRWSGWIGRWFADLREGREVPVWAVEGYGRQYGRRWDFRGPGLLFVHEDGRLVVLVDGRDAAPRGVRVDFGAREARRLGVADHVFYPYWFDVVAPDSGAAVLARYRLRLRPAGAAALRRAGIPATFPAVVRAEHPGHRSYYFAGDWADSGEVPPVWRLRGLGWWGRHQPGGDPADPSPFFWKVYLPLMRRVLDEAHAARVTARPGSPAPRGRAGR